MELFKHDYLHLFYSKRFKQQTSFFHMKTVKEILESSPEPEIIEVEKLTFKNIVNKDVYNISKPFKIDKEEFLFGRVEPRNNSELSKIFLFKKTIEGWVPVETFSPLENSEDPFISKINGNLVLGCVEVVKMEKEDDFNPENKLNYRTILYEGKNPLELKIVFEGPWKMKDIRFLQFSENKLALFSRPQGGIAGKGKIGFTIINSLQGLEHSHLNEAPLLNHFSDNEWGGANEVHSLKNGRLFVLGHIAKRNEDNSLSYYPMYFTINPETSEHSEIKILFERKHLPRGESKNERLRDVIFPGGFNENEDGAIDIYLGAGDAEAYRVRIKNNFE